MDHKFEDENAAVQWETLDIAALFGTHTKKVMDKIEKVQRRAAQFISNNFRRKASVSEMLHNLGWQSLDGRRQDQRLVLFYKIINGLASVETEDIPYSGER